MWRLLARFWRSAMSWRRGRGKSLGCGDVKRTRMLFATRDTWSVCARARERKKKKEKKGKEREGKGRKGQGYGVQCAVRSVQRAVCRV
eukprot:2954862-Rhodomonas_salina.1